MPQFNKTVSQLTRPQLLSALAAFGLDTSGPVTTLCSRLKEYLKDNEDLMDSPEYRPLFSPAQRTQYDTYPPAWGGIEEAPVPDDPLIPDNISEDGDPDSPAIEFGNEQPTDLQVLEGLPSSTLARVVDLFINNGHKSADPIVTASSSALRKRPARVLGAVTSASGTLIPEAIRKKFSGPEGWKTHVPLHYLTDKYCSISNHASTKELNDLFSFDGYSGSLLSVPKELPIDPELELNFDQWFQAFGHLLELIQTYVPEEHDLWVAHFERMLHAPNGTAYWSLWLDYDSQVRRRALNEDLDPAIFQTEIWDSLLPKHLKQAVLNSLPPQTQNNANTGKSGRHGGGGDRDHGSSGRRGHPYDDSERSKHDNSHSFRPDSSKIRCFVCGSTDAGHSARICNSNRLVNGKPTILIFKQQGVSRKDRDGASYCYTFNGRNGCSRGANCSQGKHWCTLCGDKSGIHCAQDCASL
ncbi:hypothetical protein K438DRAFT_1763966 [Mycena galopus ATCC 62051]|nr:hypothetical protein K438DRAFT_1763966 [Mycena galopus ATCC 62051]